MFDDIPEILIAPDDYDWSSFDLEKFKAWLIDEAPGVYPQHVPLWLRAVEHRYAWTCGRMMSYEGRERLVYSFNDIFGVYAWVGPRGEIYPATYASHDRVCEIIIGMCPSEAEKKYARVTQHIYNCEDTWQYVERPTTKMKNAVIDYVTNHQGAFPSLRGL